jgi:transposase-like protein
MKRVTLYTPDQQRELDNIISASFDHEGLAILTVCYKKNSAQATETKIVTTLPFLIEEEE